MDTILISDDDEDALDVSVQIIGQVEASEVPIISSPSPPLILPPTPSPPPLYRSSLDPTSDTNSISPIKTKKRTSFEEEPGKTKKASKKTNVRPGVSPKTSREEARLMKQQDLQREKLLMKAKRENAICKQEENCMTKIDRNILNILEDHDETKFQVLFDEGSMKYSIVESSDIKNCIRWTYKHTEVEDDRLVEKYNDAQWTMIVMDGKDYLSRIIAYRDKPDDPESLESFISGISQRNSINSQSNIVILVYNLANVIKAEKAKEAKTYRRNFREKYEGGNPEAPTQQQMPPISETPIHYLGPRDLQDLRLTLEIDIKYNHPNWKMHLEFQDKSEEAIKTILCYSKSIAKANRHKVDLSKFGIDWAIDADKVKASDPTRSPEELKELWIKQLQQFTAISLPIAKAIAAEYPSPLALIDQYKQLSTNEAENLLGELYVQKNFKRQVGQSISRRIHCFMTGTDPDVLIDS